MSNKPFKCNQCGKFEIPSSRAGYCRPCDRKYMKGYRERRKMKKNGNDENSVASSSSSSTKTKIKKSPGNSGDVPEFPGGQMFHGNIHPTMNHPMYTYSPSMIPQNNGINNEVLVKLMSRLDLLELKNKELELKNEQLERDIELLKKNNHFDPDAKVDPYHPRGDHIPNLNPYDLELRISYLDKFYRDLEDGKVKRILEKLTEFQERLEGLEETVKEKVPRFEDLNNIKKELECVDNLGLEIEKLKNDCDNGNNQRIDKLESHVTTISGRINNHFTATENTISGIEEKLTVNKQIIDWLTKLEEHNDRERLIINLYNSLVDIIGYINKVHRGNLSYPEWFKDYRKFEELEILRKKTENVSNVRQNHRRGTSTR